LKGDSFRNGICSSVAKRGGNPENRWSKNAARLQVGRFQSTHRCRTRRAYDIPAYSQRNSAGFWSKSQVSILMFCRLRRGVSSFRGPWEKKKGIRVSDNPNVSVLGLLPALVLLARLVGHWLRCTSQRGIPGRVAVRDRAESAANPGEEGERPQRGPGI